MKKILLYLCILTSTVIMQAQIIHVPGDYPTIQQGINHATPGDTVLVAEGTYYEQINFMGKKPLMVASRFLMDGDTSHISNTVIDGSHLTDLDNSSVVYFLNGEDTTSIICGFTIQNGKGTYESQYWLCRAGGGVWISGSGAKIINNRIVNNTVDDAQGNGKRTFGAGISTDMQESSNWVVIANNYIEKNTAISDDFEASSAGMLICCNCRIINNIISENTCINLDSYADAGGIGTWADLNWTTNITNVIQNNIIKNNTIQGYNAYGGGVFLQGVQAIFSNNEVSSNEAIATGESLGGAGGIYLIRLKEGSVVKNNVIKENSSNLWGGGLFVETFSSIPNPALVQIEDNYFIDNVAENGGAFVVNDVPVTLQNNVFSGNHAVSRGGAANLINSGSLPYIHPVTIINNSFSLNNADISGGAIYSVQSNPFIFNSIFWKDSITNGSQQEISVESGWVEIDYSDIDINLVQGTIITDNTLMNEDPFFCDPVTLNTMHYSPCVDAGLISYTCNHGNTYEASDHDINGNPRPVGAGYDIGAYDLEFWGVGVKNIGDNGLQIANYPDPFVGSTTFLYTLQKSVYVTLQIFNSFGQQVAEPVRIRQSKGNHNILWNAGRLPSGQYYYRIEAGDMIGKGKMVKL